MNNKSDYIRVAKTTKNFGMKHNLMRSHLKWKNQHSPQSPINQEQSKCLKSPILSPSMSLKECTREFYELNKTNSYEMNKRCRGKCLIINIMQIQNMATRRWSDIDVVRLEKLFEALHFQIVLYTDRTHQLEQKSMFEKIEKFSKDPDHQQAQAAIIILMSHGEEGSITASDGKKIDMDKIFSLFDNSSCPALINKPKLFFIQSCRDDPNLGPAEDQGVQIEKENNSMEHESQDFQSISDQMIIGEHEIDGPFTINYVPTMSDIFEKFQMTKCLDENRSMNEKCREIKDNLNGDNNMKLLPTQFNSIPSSSSKRLPTNSDMLIGYSTLKHFIAYRKPERGSWYMDALIEIFSKHSHNTNLCSMLNMVNGLVSEETTSTMKKQMSEYRSTLRKKTFYFFPGIRFDSNNSFISNDDVQSISQNDDTSPLELSIPNTQINSYENDTDFDWDSEGNVVMNRELDLSESLPLIDDDVYDTILSLIPTLIDLDKVFPNNHDKCLICLFQEAYRNNSPQYLLVFYQRLFEHIEPHVNDDVHLRIKYYFLFIINHLHKIIKFIQFQHSPHTLIHLNRSNPFIDLNAIIPIQNHSHR
ncbi:hypothetical protein SNEBB_004765 [Seison nebaliae]|nr:hypothetical protein SNEBB_004765 [Seison nebaliae]